MARVARAQVKALGIGVRNNKTGQRFSGLLARLKMDLSAWTLAHLVLLKDCCGPVVLYVQAL